MAANIPKGAALVGPISGSERPARTGLYLRESPKGTGKQWAWFDKKEGWGTYSGGPKRAVEKFRKGKRSSKRLAWFGLTKRSASQVPAV